MDGELKKEQIDTLFVRGGLLQGGFWGGWVVQRGSHPFFEGCSQEGGINVAFVRQVSTPFFIL